ncbi:ROK family protein [Streptomyces sp. NPDC003247]|uniref:ROK family protein n=1 Tax=Streptomyces sp. NPDC003247 TaxID=3364677 RepID=UPI0036860C20
MRADNRSLVLGHVVRLCPVARLDLAQALNLSPATITSAIRELVGQGLVEVVDVVQTNGRPRERFGPSASTVHAIGVKVMADRVVAVRVNYRGEVTASMEAPFDSHHSRATGQLADLLEAWIEEHGRKGLLGVGIGVSGIVDSESGRVVDAARAGWSDLRLAEELGDRLGTHVRVDNDVMALARAHALYGAGREHDCFMIVTLGTGLGSAVVTGGQVHRGARGMAGEIGHFTVDPTGPLCGCGANGCLEAYVSEYALAREAAASGVADDFEQLLARTESDPKARRLFESAGVRLGQALQLVVNVLDPAVVIVSGEGVRWWRHLRDAAQDQLRRGRLGSARQVSLVQDDWDDRAWARGAAACVLSSLTEPTGRRLPAAPTIDAPRPGSSGP